MNSYFTCLIGLFLCLGQGFCSSPRLLITVDSESNFTLEELQEQLGAVIVSGTHEEMVAKITQREQASDNHLTILREPLDNMYWSSRRLGYAHLHLQGDFDQALQIAQEAIAAVPRTDADLPI